MILDGDKPTTSETKGYRGSAKIGWDFLIALDMKDQIVSVVIPAFNAAGLIDETLQSVRSQSHGNLDIIVVDDGSTDATVDVVHRHIALDSRIRLIEQANAGVAAARNTGWKSAKSDIISFVDADDLWSVTKTQEQLEALRASNGAGLVYSWYVVIDELSRITLQWDGPAWQGDVFDHLLVDNFIGNGSSVLVTRKALEDAGGFEPALAAAGAGGCEDALFYLRVAEKHRFAVAPGYHIGYRYTPGNMSSDLSRMMRSWLLVRDEMKRRHQNKQSLMNQGVERFGRWLMRRAISLSQFHQVRHLFGVLFRESPQLAIKALALEVPKALKDFHWPPGASKKAAVKDLPAFVIGQPHETRP